MAFGYMMVKVKDVANQKRMLGARWDGNSSRSVTMKIIDKIQALGHAAGAGAAPSRRSLLVGAGVAGAAAIAVKALPGTAPEALATAAAGAAKVAPDTRGGYQLTAHVRRYYETTQA